MNLSTSSPLLRYIDAVRQLKPIRNLLSETDRCMIYGFFYILALREQK